ncbi:MAG: hypothetical protein R3B54_07115 [Bdellovibrionota bacterium]
MTSTQSSTSLANKIVVNGPVKHVLEPFPYLGYVQFLNYFQPFKCFNIPVDTGTVNPCDLCVEMIRYFRQREVTHLVIQYEL